MTELRISEAGTVQFPMVAHAEEIGWAPIDKQRALQKRGGEAGRFFYDEIEHALVKLNPGILSPDLARTVIEKLEALPPTIEGNRDLLEWLRGNKTVYLPDEKAHRTVRLIDFDNIENNTFQVTWEWTQKPLARKANRADVVFLINGIPVCIVEHKNPKKGDAIERAILQLRRYEQETPELLAAPQVFNVTHLIEYWYGATWNTQRKDIVRWKEKRDESYRFAVQAFFERTDFLHVLRQWILFYVQDDELRKTVLRQHQTRAIRKVVERCADPKRKRGLIWHTQGSGKTFTLLTSSRLLLEDARFQGTTVLLVVDRTELEGQLSGWVNRVIAEMQASAIAVEKAESRAGLQDLFARDFRGLIVSMIHKFDEIPKNICPRDNVFVLIDEAHRSIGGKLGTYLMAALPRATIIGFTGTPIDKTEEGKGTFKIFGADDPEGYLDKYSIKESIEDGTTLPIKHTFAPSHMTVPAERLDKEFFALAELEGVSDVEELNRVLERAVTLKAFLLADDRIAKVAAFVAKHFRESVLPLGYKAFLVGVNREACAKYKIELDKHLPPDWSEVVYTPNAADVIERPDVARLQLGEEREKTVRDLFKKSDQLPKILIVTDKLLTGYDAPVLYCMYLDKPMRDHVLLQAIARVNRPYVDAESIQKKYGLIVDFVGVLRELNKALKFDSQDVSGVIEDLDLLMQQFKQKMDAEGRGFVEAGAGAADEKFERLVYGRFADPEARQGFYEFYQQVEDLWEILSPAEELRDYIKTYESLGGLYAALRQVYDSKGGGGFLADLAHKTRSLIVNSAELQGLGRVTKSVTFNAETVAALKSEIEKQTGKIMNLVRGLQDEAEERAEEAPYLVPLKERVERIVQALDDRTITGLQAVDALAQVAADKAEADKAKAETGMGPKTFAVYWLLRNQAAAKAAKIDAKKAAAEIEALAARFPNHVVNADEQRQFRALLHKPLSKIAMADRVALIDEILRMFAE